MARLSPLSVLLVAAQLTVCLAGKQVRMLKTYREYNAFIKHHKEKTGLPVIVDFYSDSCGPCRMIAPHLNRIAKEYKGRAAFAKVNVNTNHETSSRMGVRSMPTFHFYYNGKKEHQFSGGDVNQLQQRTQQIARKARKQNVEITPQAMKEFYAEHDPSKTDEDITKILGKYTPGIGHFVLAKKMKKKYDAAPKTQRREASSGGKDKKKKKGKKNTPNLHLATVEELAAEVAKRRENMEDGGEEEEEEEALELPQYEAKTSPERVAIIGGGPAGLAAAVYASRAGLSPVIVAPPVGGQLMGKGVSVENYPGVLSNTGPGIVDLMLRQAAQFGTTFLQESVSSVDFSSRPFTLTTDNTTLSAHSVILATGSVSRWLGVQGEQDLRGGGVSSCATCDGFLFAGQPVLVVGGGDTAMEDALVLARTSSTVTVVHRGSTFRASKILQERVLAHEKIKVLWNSAVQSFVGKDEKDVDTGEVKQVLTHAVVTTQGNDGASTTQEVLVAAAFVAIGHDPSTSMLGRQVELDSNGYVTTASSNTQTSVEGVFAAGDVADHVYRQAITSAGSGAMAALDAERWLSEQGIKDGAEACVNTA